MTPLIVGERILSATRQYEEGGRTLSGLPGLTCPLVHVCRLIESKGSEWCNLKGKRPVPSRPGARRLKKPELRRHARREEDESSEYKAKEGEEER